MLIGRLLNGGEFTFDILDPGAGALVFIRFPVIVDRLEMEYDWYCQSHEQ